MDPAGTGDGVIPFYEYAQAKDQTLFSMNFMYQAPKWRLFGLDVSLAKASEE